MKTSIFGSIGLELSENNLVSIFRVGDWTNSYNNFKCKPKELKEMVKNFEENVLRYEDGKIPFNYRHKNQDKAAGWITKLSVKKGDLLAEVEWTPRAQKQISEKEWKYVSAEIAFSYEDQESGKITNNVLLGAALTNIPFVRGMNSVALSEIGGNSEQDIFIFNNNNTMKSFKKMLSILEGKKDISLSDVEILKVCLSELPEDEQTENKDAVEKVEETAKENDETAKKELSAKNAKIKELESKDLVLSEKDNMIKKLSDQVGEYGVKLSEMQSMQDKMKKEAREEKLGIELSELIKSGQILPAQRDAIQKLCLSLSQEQSNAQLAIYKDLPKKIDFSEIGSDISDPSEKQKLSFSAANEAAQKEYNERTANGEDVVLHEILSEKLSDIAE